MEEINITYWDLSDQPEDGLNVHIITGHFCDGSQIAFKAWYDLERDRIYQLEMTDGEDFIFVDSLQKTRDKRAKKIVKYLKNWPEIRTSIESDSETVFSLLVETLVRTEDIMHTSATDMALRRLSNNVRTACREGKILPI